MGFNFTEDTESTCSDCGVNIPIPEGTLIPFVKWLKCPPCKQKSDAEDERIRQEHERKEVERHEAIKNARMLELLKGLAIGRRFMGMDWEHYETKNADMVKVKTACQDFEEQFTRFSGKSLILLGSPGTGKNMIAAIIAQNLIKRQFSCLHTTAIKLVRKVKDSWTDKSISEQSVIDSFREPDLLIIDEVGVQFGSVTEQMYLTEIINERYENMKSVILISNLNIQQIKEILGERIIDRFRDKGSMALALNWPSHRGK